MRIVTVRKFIYLLTFLFVLSGCVHQWPESVPTNVTLKLVFDRSMNPFDTLYFDTKTEEVPGHDVRYVIEAYRMKPDGGYYRDAATRAVFVKNNPEDLDYETVLTVPDEGNYMIKAWVDYIAPGSQDHLYYNPDNFGEIVIHQHYGNNEFREAYVGSVQVDVVRFGSQVPFVEGTLQMARPVAKYEFITTDLVEFIERETRLAGDGKLDLDDYAVRIYYTGFMPSAFNMHSDRPNDSMTGVYYDSKIQQVSENEAKLGFDFVLANPDDASVVAAVALFDKEGNEIATTTDIHIPLKRGMLTTVKGAFLMKESSGGVSINPDFDGEFNIIL